MILAFLNAEGFRTIFGLKIIFKFMSGVKLAAYVLTGICLRSVFCFF